MKAIRKSPKYLKTFLKWLKQHIRYGVKCSNFGMDQVKCRTKGGLSFTMKMKSWNKIPKSIRQRLGKTVLSTNLYYR